ncbi:MAG: dephospho-CoA kinase, partial [Rhodocyclaceae bacterium]|nr:dephospho-CoA kinase [Rhodocyclaceae bacterium]
GIGSGKSAAADGFALLGAAIVDTDLIAHQLTAPGGGAIAALRDAFGAAAITDDGALDRVAMRERVFADPAQRKRLEGILHPMIRSASARQCDEAEAPYVVLVVPLLIESGNYSDRCNRICVVDVPEQIQVERVVSRSGLTAERVRSIMAAQASRESRCAAADDIIDNSGDLAALQVQVERLHRVYLELARKQGERPVT